MYFCPPLISQRVCFLKKKVYMSENEGFQFDRKSETPHFKEFFSAIPLVPPVSFPHPHNGKRLEQPAVTVVVVGGKANRRTTGPTIIS